MNRSPAAFVGRLLWIAAVLAAGIAAIGLRPSAASAHDVLLAADPAPDSVVSAPPARISLTFSAPPSPSFTQLAVTIDGVSHVLDPVADGATISADVPPSLLSPPGSAPARWRVGYRVVSADGHPVSGLVEFTVGTKPAAAGAAPTTDVADADEGPSQTAGVAPVLLGILIAGIPGIVGAVALVALRRRRARTAP